MRPGNIFSIILIFLLSFTSLYTHSQNRIGTRQINQAGDKYFENQLYFKAIPYYLESLKINPNDGHANYYLAESYRNLFDYGAAEVYYKKVSEVEPKQYPLSIYYYGFMLKLNGRYDQAILMFDKFLEFIKENPNNRILNENPHFKQQAHVDREGCLLALNQLSHPYDDYELRVLKSPLNSEYNDYAATIYENDNIIAFTSGRSKSKGRALNQRLGESFTDIYRFKNENGDWSEYKERDNFNIVNSRWGNGSGVFNAARDKFYYTNCHDDFCHINVSKLVNGRWQEPLALNANINVPEYSSKHPALSPGGDTLFFSSDRPGGFGMSDIWMSLSSGDEDWGPPVNMGQQVNTPLLEIAPFYSHQDRTLFFASDGHRGFGGFDIFMAKGYSFTNPEIFNMGYPFNSNKDDLYITMGKDKGYLSSNRKGGEGKFDIYSFKVETQEAVIAQVDNEEAIAGRNSVFSDDFQFDSEERVKIEHIISIMVASKIYGIELAFTEEDLAFYQNLSDDDKDRIERIVNSRVRNLSDSDLTALRDEDEFYYNNLTEEGKEHVDGIVNSYLEERGLAASVSMEEGDEAFYENLAEEEQATVSRLVAARLKAVDKQEYFGESVEDRRFYANLSKNEKDRIDRFAVAYLKAKADFLNIPLATPDKNYYTNLSGGKKLRVEQSIHRRLRNLSSEPGFELTEEDQEFYWSLSEERRKYIDRVSSAYMIADITNLSLQLAEEDRNVYRSLPDNEKAIYDKLMLIRIRNFSKSDQYFYQKLTVAERALLERIAKKYNDVKEFDALLAILTPEEKRLYDRWISERPSGTHRMIAAKSRSLAAPLDYFYQDPLAYDQKEIQQKAVELYFQDLEENLRVQSKDFYSNLSVANRSTLQNILTTPFRGVPKASLNYFLNADSEQKQYLVQLLGKYLASNGNLQPDAFETGLRNFYNNLTSTERTIVEEMLTSSLVNLTAEEQQFYLSLSDKERDMLGELANSFYVHHLSVLGLTLTDPEIEFYQNVLTTDRKKLLENTMNGMLSALTDPEKAFFEDLTIEERKRLASILGLTFLTNEQVDTEKLNPKDLAFYESLNSSERKILKNISNSVYEDWHENDRQYLHSLSPMHQAVFGKLIKAHLMAKISSGDGNLKIDLDDAEVSEPAVSYKQLTNAPEKLITGNLKKLPAGPNQYYSQAGVAEKDKIEDVAAFYVAHKLSKVINKMESGTLELFQDKNPLETEIIYNIISSPTIDLTDSQRDYLNSLTPDEQIKIAALAAEFLAMEPGINEVSYNKTCQDYIDNLSALRKNQLGQILQSPVNLLSGASADLYGNLSREQRQTLLKITGARNFSTNGEVSYLVATETLNEYRAIKREHGDKVDQLINELLDKEVEAVASKTASTKEETQVTQDLSGKEVIKKDIDYYSSLDEASKKRIDRIVAINLVNEAYSKNPNLRDEDLKLFEELPNSEKNIIKRIAKVFADESAGLRMSNLEISTYQNMAPEKREWVNRLIVLLGFGGNSQESISMARQDDRYLESLNDSELTRVQRILEIRKAGGRIIGDNLEVDYHAFNLEDVVAEINTFNANDYERVSITGKLINIISGLPAAEVEIPLLNENDEVVKITTTDDQGTFRYSNLPANRNYRIVVEDRTKRITETDSYFIKDLEIEGSEKILGKIDYENIFFDLNEHTLRSEAKKTLDELIELSQNYYSNIQVEINAYTDHLGSDEYNLELSRKRGKAAFKYLVENGMPRTAIVINARGKAPIAAVNSRYGRQLNRRVELEIFGEGVNYDPQYTTYLIKPKATLYSLAKAFDMTIEEIRRINGLGQNENLTAYRPLRLKKTKQEIAMDLVYAESASTKGYQSYSVKEGDTVHSIALKFNIPEELIIEINNLRDIELKPGQTIRVYVQ